MYKKFHVRASPQTATHEKFRVRTPVKTFRDLEVYQESTKLAAAVFNLQLPQAYQSGLAEEMQTLRQISKMPPKLIVESYNDKFGNFALAERKLEIALQSINLVVAKLDFLSAAVEDEKFRAATADMLGKFQRVKMKTLNLKRAWGRVFRK